MTLGPPPSRSSSYSPGCSYFSMKEAVSNHTIVTDAIRPRDYTQGGSYSHRV
jgi:hypothetical protein